MPSGQVVTLACTLGQTLQQLKEHFSSELKMPVNLILIMHDGKYAESVDSSYYVVNSHHLSLGCSKHLSSNDRCFRSQFFNFLIYLELEVIFKELHSALDVPS